MAEEWVQPDDMWVGQPITTTIHTWYRNLALDWDHLPPEDAIQIFRDRWLWLTHDATGAFESRENGVDVTLATESVFTGEQYPRAGYQNFIGSGVHQNWQTFAEFSAPLNPSNYPLYDPARPGGVDVEYEAPQGTYFDTHRFQVPYDLEGDYSLQDLPRFAYTPAGGIITPTPGTYPGAGGGFLAWDRTGSLTGPWGTAQVTVDSRELTITPLFHPHLNDGPTYTSQSNGTLYLGRHTATIPRSFGVARLYRPPRYRLVYPQGSWEKRQMQTPGGTVGSWPKRQMQSAGRTGTWPKRAG